MLLFGIPTNSSRNFLHEYNAMRVGAILEKGSDTLKVRRRKGNKDTLLGDDDMPIPSGEGALVPFLAGADRPCGPCREHERRTARGSFRKSVRGRRYAGR